jgi:hypothetical protein
VAKYGLKGCERCKGCRLGAREAGPSHFSGMNEIARVRRQTRLGSRRLDYDPELLSLVDVICQMQLIQLLRLLNIGAALQRPEQQRLYSGGGKYGCTLPLLRPEINPSSSYVLLDIRSRSIVGNEGKIGIGRWVSSGQTASMRRIRSTAPPQCPGR